MCIPLELEHLIRTATVDPKPPTLATQLLAVEERRALEVEHYLRACALRLGLPERDNEFFNTNNNKSN